MKVVKGLELSAHWQGHAGTKDDVDGKCECDDRLMPPNPSNRATSHNIMMQLSSEGCEAPTLALGHWQSDHWLTT